MSKRKESILNLNKQGESLMELSKSAGQSVVGLEQQLNNFQERWDNLSRTIEERRNLLADGEKKKVFLEEVKHVLLSITEITGYIDSVTIDMKHNPKELLTLLEVSQSHHYITYCNSSCSW